jgi:hypothetical protein
MPKIRTQHVVIGGGILVVLLLLWQFIRPRGGEDDPPPIIVSSGGSIKAEFSGTDTGTLASDVWNTWYHVPDANQSFPEWFDLTISGAVNDDILHPACDSFSNVDKLTVAYGGPGSNKNIDVSIGRVWNLKTQKYLKFVSHPADGKQDLKYQKRVDFDPDDHAVTMDSLTIRLQTGKPITCTFKTPIDPKTAWISIQEGHAMSQPKQAPR